MANSQPCTIDGVSYPSKKAATVALFQAGEPVDRIVERVGSTPAAVKVALRGIPRRNDPATAKGTWTPEKRDKARRLFGTTMIYIAEAINVPPREFLTYVLHGVVPPSQDIADPADIRWQDGDAPREEQVPAALLQHLSPPPEAFTPIEGEDDDAVDADHLVSEPARDDDEAELARLAEQEGGEEDEPDTAQPEEPAPAPARFPVPPPRPAPAVEGLASKPKASPADVASPGEVFCLMDDMDRYLHESLDGMTTNPRYAWKGGADKVAKITKQLPHLKQLDRVAFNK